MCWAECGAGSTLAEGPDCVSMTSSARERAEGPSESAGIGMFAPGPCATKGLPCWSWKGSSERAALWTPFSVNLGTSNQLSRPGSTPLLVGAFVVGDGASRGVVPNQLSLGELGPFLGAAGVWGASGVTQNVDAHFEHLTSVPCGGILSSGTRKRVSHSSHRTIMRVCHPCM